MQYLILYVTHLLPRDYFHNKNEMIVNLVEVMDSQTDRQDETNIHPTLPPTTTLCGYDYLSMLELKLIHVSKGTHMLFIWHLILGCYWPALCDVMHSISLHLSWFWCIGPCEIHASFVIARSAMIPYCIQHMYRPISQTPLCISPIFHNAPFCNRNVHISVFKIALWDTGLVHCGICATGLLQSRITLIFNFTKDNLNSKKIARVILRARGTLVIGYLDVILFSGNMLNFDGQFTFKLPSWWIFCTFHILST